jgi:hypothetical protein
MRTRSSDDDYIAQLMKGVAAWNTWRTKTNLSGAHFSKTRLVAEF